MEHGFEREQRPEHPPLTHGADTRAKRERTEELEATSEVFRTLMKQPVVTPSAGDWRRFSEALRQRIAAQRANRGLRDRIRAVREFFALTDSTFWRGVWYALLVAAAAVAAAILWYLADAVFGRSKPATGLADCRPASAGVLMARSVAHGGAPNPAFRYFPPA
jgi:hypothetical protein